MRFARNKRFQTRYKTLSIVLACTTALSLAWATFETVQNINLRAAQSKDTQPIHVYELDGTSVRNQSAVAADTVVASFEGGEIYYSEIANDYTSMCEYYEALGISDYTDDVKQSVLRSAIENKLLIQKAQQFNVYEATADQQAALEESARTAYEALIDDYLPYHSEDNLSEEENRQACEKWLNENGISFDLLLEEAQTDAWRERLYDCITADQTISDDELKSFYETQLVSDEMNYSANFAEYETDADSGRAIVWHPEGVRIVDTILISFSEEQLTTYNLLLNEMENGNGSNIEEIDALYASISGEAQEALNRLQNGENFDTLAAEYGSINECGLYVGENSSYLGDDFVQAALSLQNIGDISAAVNCDLGICILRYTQDVTAGAVPFDEIKDKLRSSYTDELKLTYYNNYVSELYETANVQYYSDRF